MIRRELYPDNWEQISRTARIEAQWRCQCEGECGLHHGRRCVEVHNEPAQFARGKIMLTLAHLDYPGGPCTCEEQTGRKCGEREHLKVMCQRCHLRIDRARHIANAKRTRHARKAAGTLPGLEVTA